VGVNKGCGVKVKKLGVEKGNLEGKKRGGRKGVFLGVSELGCKKVTRCFFLERGVRKTNNRKPISSSRGQWGAGGARKQIINGWDGGEKLILGFFFFFKSQFGLKAEEKGGFGGRVGPKRRITKQKTIL